MNGETIRTITIKGQSEGLDKLTADVNKLAAAQENVAVVSEQSARRVLSLEDAWKRQTMRLDEAARAQANIARETKVADAALREGLATQAQHAQRLEQINQRYTKTADATKVVAHQTGLARHELVNLGRQAQDVGVSLMSGQSPFTVLVQQGTQIADVFATSGGSIRGFFSQAIGWAKGFLLTWGGIATAVAAVGAAAVYTALQFRTASTTVEQALEEQNRLLKEARLEARGTSQFQAIQNEIDLRSKLNEEIAKTVRLAERRATRPMQVAGEMGEAPTGIGPLGGSAGYAKIVDAVQKMQAAIAAGQPALQQYSNDLGAIGKAHPELAKVVQEMINGAKSAVELERAVKRAADAVNSLAQSELRNLIADEAVAAAERMAQHVLAIRDAYPGMSVEVAKQLDALQGQLTVAQARTGAEQIIAQQYVTQNTLLAQGKTLEEAMAIAAAQRQVAEANVSKTIADQIHALEDQIKLNNARVQGTEDVIEAQLAYNNAIRQGASEFDALALAQATQQAADSRNQKTHMDMLQAAEQGLGDVGDQIQHNTQLTNNWSQAVAGLTARWAELTIPEGVESRLDMLGVQSTGSYVSSWDPLMMEQRKSTYENLYGGAIAKKGGTGFGEYTYYVPDFDKIRGELSELVTSNEDLTKSTDSLNATMQDALSPFYSQDPRTTKLGFRAGVSGNPDWMTGATNANPLVAVLGAGATAPGMADGGSFTVGGGYSAVDNAMAVFPVASGEEVIVNRNKGGRGAQAINIDNRIIIQGAVSDDALSKMKVSRYQQAQRMRGQLAG